jgi:gliding motility-associated-like protein
MVRNAFILAWLALSYLTHAQTLTRAEFFFNADPGTGNGTALPVTPSGTLDVNFSIPITSLSAGFHRLTIRFRDNTGKWSHGQARNFYITPPLPVIPQAVNITRAEYFIDSDPGIGNGVSVPVTATASLNQNVAVPLNSLAPGFHNITFRFADDLGRWSHGTALTFYIQPNIVPPAAAVTIVRAEYFLDTDPGVGKGVAIPISAASPLDNTYALDLGNVTPGFHRLGIRYLDDRNRWSHATVRTFYVQPAVALSDKKIVQVDYFFDVNPEQNPSATPNEIPVAPTADVEQVFLIEASGLTEGSHVLYLRVKDDKGFYSYPVKESFTVLSCIPPAPPVISDQSRCGAGTLTLTPTGATGTQQYRWYENNSTFTPLFTGSSFTTPVITTGASYWVSIYDPVTLCESSRTEVKATVISTDAPMLNISNVTICEGGFIKISAPSGYTTYEWSNGETTREIIVTTSGTYTVVGITGTCRTEVSATATVIVSPRPQKPVITVSGSTDLCEGGSVTLTAPAGFSYRWSNGQTTQTLTVSTAGTYTVTLTNADNCPSEPSDPVVVRTFTRPSQPVIQVFGTTTLCGSNTVTLLAPVGFSIYQWSNGLNTQSITVSAAGSYTLIVGNAANCLSVASAPVNVTVTGQPCVPVGGTNNPPAITQTTTSVKIEGRLEFDLTKIITDTDNNIDFNTLRVVGNRTARGINAFVDAAYFLQVDYSGNPFTGSDRVTIEVCDLGGLCVQQVIDIDVVGAVIVYNGVSPDGDGHNDFMLIQYIDVVEGAAQNKVSIYNRWGDIVFEVQNYNNTDRSFTGLSNSGNELPSGNYFYKIEFASGLPTLSGYLTLIR